MQGSVGGAHATKTETSHDAGVFGGEAAIPASRMPGIGQRLPARVRSMRSFGERIAADLPVVKVGFE